MLSVHEVSRTGHPYLSFGIRTASDSALRLGIIVVGLYLSTRALDVHNRSRETDASESGEVGVPEFVLFLGRQDQIYSWFIEALLNT